MKTVMTDPGFIQHNVPAEMRVERNETFSFIRINNLNVYDQPVILVDLKGRILYANKASFPLLREWNCLANDYLPDTLVNHNPALLDMEASFDLQIDTKSASFYLDVIGFKESGYIGMYGYRIENKTGDHAGNGLRIAQS
jgi:hypothetical protein